MTRRAWASAVFALITMLVIFAFIYALFNVGESRREWKKDCHANDGQVVEIGQDAKCLIDGEVVSGQ